MRQSKGTSPNQSIIDDSLLSSSAEIGTLKEGPSSLKENCNKAFWEKQNVRRRFEADKIDLEKKLNLFDFIKPPMQEGTSLLSGQSEELRQLLETKTKYEVELATYGEQITHLRETILQLRDENSSLRSQLDDLKSNNHGKVVKELEEEVGKWETLYFESAEVGATTLSRLEEELEQMRLSSLSSQKTAETAKYDMESVCNALKATFASARAKQQELKAYKQKSRERVSVLEEMLEKATVQKAEKDRELTELKAKQERDEYLHDKIRELEADVQAKTAIIERERNQAIKREARLKESIRKMQKPESGEAIDGAFTKLSSLLEESIGWCGPTERDLDPETTPRITGLGTERASMR